MFYIRNILDARENMQFQRRSVSVPEVRYCKRSINKSISRKEKLKLKGPQHPVEKIAVSLFNICNDTFENTMRLFFFFPANKLLKKNMETISPFIFIFPSVRWREMKHFRGERNNDQIAGSDLTK